MNEPIDMPASKEFTALIESIRAVRDGSEMALLLTISENGKIESRKLVIPTKVYCEKKIQKGAISKQVFDELDDLSQRFFALRCGEKLLAFGPNTEQVLIRKIMRHGFMRSEAEYAAEILRKRGFIREKEDLRREVEKCVRKLWGKRRIQLYLQTKGFADETLADLPKLLEDVDFSEQCANLIEKHYGEVPTDRDERDRMFSSLTRYGYSLDEIRNALRMMQ